MTSHRQPGTAPGSTLTPAPTAADPTFMIFTDDADNPLTPAPLDYEEVAMPRAADDEQGYRVGSVYALVRVAKPKAPAASMYGHTAIAFAVDAEGVPVLRPSGNVIEVPYTRMMPKADLLADPAGAAARLRRDVIEGALRELLVELAVVAANDVAGI